jgi:hypothetical protein
MALTRSLASKVGPDSMRRLRKTKT